MREELSYHALHEPWCEYVAEDGAHIKIRACVLRVYRKEDGEYEIEAQFTTNTRKPEPKTKS